MSREATALRHELRGLVKAHVPDDFLGAFTADPADLATAQAFCRLLADRGMLCMSWPPEFGGRGSSVWEQTVVREEMWAHHEPRGAQYMGVNWVGPTLMRYGTPEQQRTHLPPIARGEVIWCQGFSEPEAGSDLASLRTSATRDGDGWRINGQKIWTSYATMAQWCFLLARTTRVLILEELGRAAATSRYLGAVLAVGALTALSPNDSRDALLSDVGTGSVITALVTDSFRLERSADGVRLSGRAEFVPDAADVDRVLVIADDDGVAVIVDACGLTVTEQPVLDQTRRLAVVVADGVELDEASVWQFDGDPAAAVQRLRDRAAVAVACDSLGLAEAMLAATVDHTSVRHQFGRPIGSFQAVKHACADMLVHTSVARQLVGAAVSAVSDGADASVATSMAKSYACAAAVDVV
ncbi:MAG: hypothetical protein QOF25_855, partial [Mycobacterium sp.]|nr:hypothetical protein [Mycobacterium sp.]